MANRPITVGPAVRAVRDVLLVPTNGVVDGDWEQHQPAGDPPVELGRAVRLTQCLAGVVEAERIMDACEPPGENFKPHRQFGCRYAYVRELPVEEYARSRGRWDHDEAILAAVTLSRLIRDNAHSTEYAVRVVEFSDGHVKIIPGPVNLEGSLVYRVRSGRDWLDAEEMAKLGVLLDHYWHNKHGFPNRLSNAIWLTEQAARRRDAAEALVTIVSGLEALISTGPDQAVKQFKQRVPKLAAEVGVPFSRGMAQRAYDKRSDSAHGRRLGLIPGRHLEEPVRDHTQPETQAMHELSLIQDVLRACVRKAIDEPEFAAHFRSDESVRAKWPVENSEEA